MQRCAGIPRHERGGGNQTTPCRLALFHRGDAVAHWPCRFDLSNRRTSHRPESSLHDHFRLFGSAQQSLLSYWPSTAGGAGGDCLFHRVRSVDPGSLWLSIRPAAADGAGGVDVSDDALAALSASVRNSPFLPVLLAVGGGDHHADYNCIGRQKLENRRLIPKPPLCQPPGGLPRLTSRC